MRINPYTIQESTKEGKIAKKGKENKTAKKSKPKKQKTEVFMY